MFWLRFEIEIRPSKLAINFLIITARTERKVRLCVKLFDFFRGWILIRLTRNLSHFVPNSVEILGWNFRKKTVSGEFFINFVQTKYILYRHLWNSGLISAISFCVRIALKKFTQVLSYVVCTQVRRHAHKQITKTRYGEEKSGRFVLWRRVLFTLGLGLTTPYSLRILVWNFYQTFVTVSIAFWLRFELEIRPTKLAINFLIITARTERKFRLSVKLFNFFRGWILIRLTWNLSCFVPNLVEIFGWNFRKKTISGEFFINSVQTKAILYRNLWNSGLISAISFLVHISFKKFTQVLWFGFCTEVRRHVHKKITKWIYGEEQAECFVFGKPVLSLSVWELLCLTPWVFWYDIFTRHSSLCLLSFGWDLSPRFVPQDWQ